MPTPLKPCDGAYSEEVQDLLLKNKDRAQWADHPCQTCGLVVAATQVKGKWVPSQHWPSVKYPARKTAEAPKTANRARRQPASVQALAG